MLFASLIGTTIEFFDFYIYATAAVLVFPKLFFPASDPATAALLTMGVSTVTIGLLPAYQTIGFAAPLLLALYRFGEGLWLAQNYGLPYVGHYQSSVALLSLIGLLTTKETKDTDLRK